MNKDGKVEIDDVALILRFAVGVSPSSPRSDEGHGFVLVWL